MSRTKIQFVYFDLGRVLVHFDHEQMCRQMAEVSGLPVDRVRDVVLHGDMLQLSETGELNARQYYDEYCRRLKVKPDFDALKLAGSAIFEVYTQMLPLVTHLRATGQRMGVLSNTNDAHWEYCVATYRFLTSLFDFAALSFEIGAVKPDAKIYQAAADMAGVAPDEIFFTDDRADNVEGARAFGFDAVQFENPQQLARQLRARGLAFNY
ncbi:MAG: HAD family phosphatase [Pirellulaceae bacterium]|nr:HAD family phosphatase [Planctomycetales bacterium]